MIFCVRFYPSFLVTFWGHFVWRFSSSPDLFFLFFSFFLSQRHGGVIGPPPQCSEPLSKCASEPRNPSKMVAESPPQRCQKGAQETLGASRINQHRSPKRPSKTTRLPAYNTTKKIQNHKYKNHKYKHRKKHTANRFAGVGLVG